MRSRFLVLVDGVAYDVRGKNRIDAGCQVLRALGGPGAVRDHHKTTMIGVPGGVVTELAPLTAFEIATERKSPPAATPTLKRTPGRSRRKTRLAVTSRKQGRQSSDTLPELMEAVRALDEAPIHLVWVPDLVRSLSSRMSTEQAHAALLLARRKGLLELRPESGVGRISAEDAALCPLDSDRIPLSHVRLLGDSAKTLPPKDRRQAPTASATWSAPASLTRLKELAAQTLTAAEEAKTGRWGEHKVFISHVWEELQRRNVEPDMSLAAFKRFLVLANQKRLIALSRADLVSAMDPEDVRRSEVESLGSRFHFINTHADSPAAHRAPGETERERLKDFAEQVNTAVPTVLTTDALDKPSEKAWIVDVWKAVGGMSLAAFKKKLAEAYRAALVGLQRVDLAPAFERDWLTENRIDIGEREFHYVTDLRRFQKRGG